MPTGDYVDSYVENIVTIRGMQYSVSDADGLRVALRVRWGLNRPLYVQYVSWMKNVVQAKFGMSMVHARPLSEVLGDRMLMTVILAMATVLFTWVMALPIGIYSAMRQRSVENSTFTFLGFIGLAVPDFMLALVMMYFAFVWFDFDIGACSPSSM